MLTTEEVDIDYFTPTTSSTLSTIFINNKEEESQEKSSLKYNPPPPPVINKLEEPNQLTQGQTKSENPKPSQVDIKLEEPEQTALIFADIVYTYEWFSNAYLCRGSLGFAIYNFVKLCVHKLFIYDSNRVTLSCLTIGKNTEIKVNYANNTNIAYYDDAQKFWIVNPPPHKLKELLNILNNLQVNLTGLMAENSGNIDTDKVTKTTIVNKKDSDTDAALNRIRDSLLIKLSNIGLPVLPQIQMASSQKITSTDINHPQKQEKLKSTSQLIHDKNITTETTHKDVPTEQMTNATTKQNNEQIVPVRTTKIAKPKVAPEESHMGLFLSEQRVSNSELRINMNRMSDKLDLLINKVKDEEIIDKSNPCQFQNDIVKKLLNEYEKKIKKYEDFINLAGYDCDMLKHSAQHNSTDTSRDTKVTAQKLSHLEQLCKEKDIEITQLKHELHKLNNKADQLQISESSLSKDIGDIKDNLTIKNNHTDDVIMKLEGPVNIERQINENMNKLKKIMNDTFQAISDNFDDEERYTGSKIKSIVGLVVRKTTMDSLKEFE